MPGTPFNLLPSSLRLSGRRIPKVNDEPGNGTLGSGSPPDPMPPWECRKIRKAALQGPITLKGGFTSQRTHTFAP